MQKDLKDYNISILRSLGDRAEELIELGYSVFGMSRLAPKDERLKVIDRELVKKYGNKNFAYSEDLIRIEARGKVNELENLIFIFHYRQDVFHETVRPKSVRSSIDNFSRPFQITKGKQIPGPAVAGLEIAHENVFIQVCEFFRAFHDKGYLKGVTSPSNLLKEKFNTLQSEFAQAFLKSKGDGLDKNVMMNFRIAPSKGDKWTTFNFRFRYSVHENDFTLNTMWANRGDEKKVYLLGSKKNPPEFKTVMEELSAKEKYDKALRLFGTKAKQRKNKL